MYMYSCTDPAHTTSGSARNRLGAGGDTHPQRERAREAGGVHDAKDQHPPPTHYRGTSLMRNTPPPTVGLYPGSYGGPHEGGLFLMSEVPLYSRCRRESTRSKW